MALFDLLPGHTNAMAPGKAFTTGIGPTTIFRSGKPRLLFGAPGGSMIISVVLQSILNLVDFGMSPLNAGPSHVFAVKRMA
jgi:gamma-glutamyltranspeptidase/glutathione hydrolase